MMGEWWWVDNLRATIHTTLIDLRGNTLARRSSNVAELTEDVSRLAQENAELSASL